MQLPNDDMDELMRRAAEDYPLKTGPGDWNAVKKALDAEAAGPGRKKDNRRFLWLLLLLPLGLICNRYLSFTPGSDEEYTERKAPAPSLAPGGNDIQKEQTATPGTTGRQEESRPQTGQPFTVQPQTPGTSGDQPVADKEQVRVNREQSPIFNKNIIQQQPSERKTIRIATVKTTRSKTTRPVLNPSTPKAERNENTYAHKKKESISAGQEVTPPSTTTATVTKESAVSPLEKYPSADTAAVQEKPKESVTEQPTAATPVAPDSATTAAVATNEKRAKKKGKRFYLGLLAAGDATTIRFQKVDHMGTGYGALAGYELNDKWSIEAGALSVKKEYYTDGRHFNTSKIYMPQNSEITSVEGNCRMIEIPVAVKYNFSTGRNVWFGTAGISSYLMKAEHYSYIYYYPLTGQSVERYRSYSNSSNHFVASALLSGGYQFRIGRHSTFRLEPYVKIPLKGLGIGSLPLFSTGLQAGFTRKLF